MPPHFHSPEFSWSVVLPCLSRAMFPARDSTLGPSVSGSECQELGTPTLLTFPGEHSRTRVPVPRWSTVGAGLKRRPHS